MNKVTITKNTVQETLIIPLYARKLSSKMYPNLFKDNKAEDILKKIDYDFSGVSKREKGIMHRLGALEVAMRQYDLAFEVKEYLKSHPSAAIINLGCGLDQTAEDCDNGRCKIYNVDYKDVIEVRNNLLPPTDRVINISTDLNETDWFKQIDKSQGTIFFASGVFYYFRTEEFKNLINKMSGYFKGGALVFDCAGKRAVKVMVKTWLKQSGITDVGAYFYVNDIGQDILPWIRNTNVSSKAYMLGYNDLKNCSVNSFLRLLSKTIDKIFKMKIIRFAFSE